MAYSNISEGILGVIKAEKLQGLGFSGSTGPGVRDAGISHGVGNHGMFSTRTSLDGVESGQLSSCAV